MASWTVKIFAAAAVLAGFSLYGQQPTRADPMKCSGEEKACITSCTKTATTALSICLTACGARKSYCVKTGCWDNGRQRYCGLAKQ